MKTLIRERGASAPRCYYLNLQVSWLSSYELGHYNSTTGEAENEHKN
jgi:hypothetical protein